MFDGRPPQGRDDLDPGHAWRSCSSAFGALVAAGLPLLLGLTAVGRHDGPRLVRLPRVSVDENLSSVVVLVGLAVGVDYSLFYIRREREERRPGRDPRRALEAAAATSGRAVLVSGFTVMAAMAGMYFTGDNGFASMATGTILVVGVAMLGLADRAAGNALQARRSRRQGPHPVLRQAHGPAR
jgi:uncharacterized membrane protein YdfJ with MMPL/SSD domain